MKVKTSYLQMFSSPAQDVRPPREGLSVLHVKKPSIEYYRFLYDRVGREYEWTSRKKLSDAELAAVIHDPLLEVHVLMADGQPAGFAELDRRSEGEIELVQFGLVPEYISQGLGKYFLNWTIQKAWSYAPRRFWLHTCTIDHPAALPNYLKAGFAVYKEEFKDWNSPAERIRAAIDKNPRQMTLQLARDLGVPEVEVIRALPAERVTELDAGRWQERLASLEALASLRVLVSNGVTTIEVDGQFGGFSTAGEFFNVQTDTLDMHIRRPQVAAVFAVEKPGHMDGTGTCSFQLFDNSGAAAFKVFLNFGAPIRAEREAAFNQLRNRFRCHAA